MELRFEYFLLTANLWLMTSFLCKDPIPMKLAVLLGVVWFFAGLYVEYKC